jgi:hypothetical protein
MMNLIWDSLAYGVGAFMSVYERLWILALGHARRAWHSNSMDILGLCISLSVTNVRA